MPFTPMISASKFFRRKPRLSRKQSPKSYDMTSIAVTTAAAAAAPTFDSMESFEEVSFNVKQANGAEADKSGNGNALINSTKRQDKEKNDDVAMESFLADCSWDFDCLLAMAKQAETKKRQQLEESTMMQGMTAMAVPGAVSQSFATVSNDKPTGKGAAAAAAAATVCNKPAEPSSTSIETLLGMVMTLQDRVGDLEAFQASAEIDIDSLRRQVAMFHAAPKEHESTAHLAKLSVSPVVPYQSGAGEDDFAIEIS